MPPHDRTPVPALVFGSHITALGVLRLLTRRGVPAYVVDETSDIIIRSRWYRPAERRLAETTDSATLADYLDGLSLPRGVLLPCHDRWAEAVSGLPETTSPRFVASLPSRAVLEQFVDKRAFATLVDQLHIPRPRTFPVATLDELAAVPDAAIRDGFLKPTQSHLFYARFGTKGQFVRNLDDAARIIELGAQDGLSFLLQEWIPGGPSATILLDGFVDRHGTVAAMVARRRVRMDPPRIANTCLDVTIPLSEVTEAADHARRLLAAVDYRGIYSVEYKFDARDGHFKVIELNARPFWLIAHIANAGADLAWMAYRDALEEPVEPVTSYQVGRYGMYEVPEIAALIRAYSHGRRPDGPVVRPWLRGDHTLLWPRDPLPGVFDLSRAVAGRIRSAPAKVRRLRERRARQAAA